MKTKGFPLKLFVGDETGCSTLAKSLSTVIIGKIARHNV
jgi:hypothetical protein